MQNYIDNNAYEDKTVSKFRLKAVTFGTIIFITTIFSSAYGEIGNPLLERENAQTTTYVICYFGSMSSNTYKYGLNLDNSYATIKGEWYTPSTGTTFTRFIDNYPNNAGTIEDEEVRLCSACNQAAKYYHITSLLTAFFASNGGSGTYNYPIVVGSNLLYGNY